MGNSPLIEAATITALAGAVIALLVSFGVPVTDQQTAAIMSIVAIVAPFAVPVLARGKWTSLADPKDEDGRALTRAGTEEPTLKQQRSMGVR